MFFNKRMTKPFERANVFNERMTKPFERADVFDERVTKPFERADDFDERMTEAVQTDANIFLETKRFKFEYLILYDACKWSYNQHNRAFIVVGLEACKQH